MDDRIEQARSGDKAAFGGLVQDHWLMLVRLAWRMVGDEALAQDLAQETILQAWFSIDRLREPARFTPWLYGIGLNVCRNFLRENRREPLSLDDLLGGCHKGLDELSVSSAEMVIEARELHERVRNALAILTLADRAAVDAFYYDGLSTQDAAAALGISPGALRVRLHKARQYLRAYLLPVSSIPTQEIKVMIPVELLQVFHVQTQPEAAEARPSDYQVIMLLDEVGGRVLPIWVGFYEGTLIEISLRQTQMPRPMTTTYTHNLLKAAGATVEGVDIARLTDEVFYATTRLRAGSQVQEVDARPSDAIGLAVVTGAPIRVAEAVLEQAGIPMGPEFRSQVDTLRQMSRQALEAPGEPLRKLAPVQSSSEGIQSQIRQIIET
jgi:RNA polymerase sigma factor (sigma-70 family)